MNKQYLGDSVYVQQDGVGIVLTTENGFEATNIIHIENEVFDALLRYLKLKVVKECEDERRIHSTRSN